MNSYRSFGATSILIRKFDPDKGDIKDFMNELKKGKDSVGVAKQYCETVGKVGNCQAGMFAAYVSENGYAMIFIQEKRFANDYLSHRKKCKLPEDTFCKTGPQPAVEMLNAANEENTLPFRYVLADSVCGISPNFITAPETLPDRD